MISLHEIKQYKLLKCIGQGTFARVYKSYDSKKDRLVVLKLLSIEKYSLEELPEYRYWKRNVPKHDHLVDYYEVFEHENRHCVIQEYIEGEELLEYLEMYSNPRKVLPIACSLAEAIYHLHSRGIHHRDIKLDNIMITNEGRLVLIDMGFASFKDDPKSYSQTNGTLHYASPEVMSNAITNENCDKVDVWSYGVVLYILMNKVFPFDSKKKDDTIHKIEHYNPPFNYKKSINDRFNASYFNMFVRSTLSKDCFERPHISSILELLYNIPMFHVADEDKTLYDWMDLLNYPYEKDKCPQTFISRFSLEKDIVNYYKLPWYKRLSNYIQRYTNK